MRMQKTLTCENYIEINGKCYHQSEVENFSELMEKIFTGAMKNIGFERKKEKTA